METEYIKGLDDEVNYYKHTLLHSPKETKSFISILLKQAIKDKKNEENKSKSIIKGE